MPEGHLRLSWYNVAAGRPSGVVYGAAFGHFQRARVEVYISGRSKEWNKRLFDRLEERRESIETALGTELDWSRLDDRAASRISLARDGSIDDKEDTLEEIRDWMLEWLPKLKEVFRPVLEELASEFG